MSAEQGGNPAPWVIPTLQQWRGRVGELALSARSRIVVRGEGPAPIGVARHFADQLASMSGVRLPVLTGATTPRANDIVLHLTSCPVAGIPPPFESYDLDIGASVLVEASDVHGLRYGLLTVLQMLKLNGADTQGGPLRLEKGAAFDSPRRLERSIMLDVGRKFASKQFLLDYIRFMGTYKLNTLHLHLNDHVVDPKTRQIVATNFRLKSDRPGFEQPKSDDGRYYTRADWDELEDAAALEGVTIVPEFDTPGHAASLLRLHPELALAGDRGGSLDPARPESLVLVKAVFDEFLPWFRSPYIHIGADEVNLGGGHALPADEVAYTNALASYLESKGKHVQTWGNENLAGLGLQRSLIVQHWQHDKKTNFDWSLYVNRWSESSGEWYIVPFVSYFKPRLDARELYERWEQTSPQTERAMGGQICVWNDLGDLIPYTFEETVHDALKEAVPAAGQVFWQGRAMTADGQPIPYAVLRRSVARLQYGFQPTTLRGPLE
ncbi:family 20 glycosylhydrolase [Burkholderiaceae bacterium UC74_6]